MTSLKEQLERARFERALDLSESIAEHHHVINTAELERLNNILNGRPEDADPWRDGPVTLTLPSGRTETMALIADPKVTARDKLYAASEVEETGAFLDAAVTAYVGLVLAHPFKDANRRTAVLAAHYFLKKHGLPVSGVALHEMNVGDLRDPEQVRILKDGIQALVSAS